MLSTITSPLTVLMDASSVSPPDQGRGADGAELEGDVARHRDGEVGARLVAERLEHVDEVVPAQLRVVDLEGVAVDRDQQIAAGDGVHLDPGGRLVVADDVDLAGDEADLELAHRLDVDDLGTVDEPLLSWTMLGLLLALYRVLSNKLCRDFGEVGLYRELRVDEYCSDAMLVQPQDEAAHLPAIRPLGSSTSG